MDKKQLTRAMVLARTATDQYDWTTLERFSGCALPDFQPIYCTLWEVSRHIRYQAMTLSGVFDMNEIHEIANIGRKKFMIIDDVNDGVPSNITIKVF